MHSVLEKKETSLVETWEVFIKNQPLKVLSIEVSANRYPLIDFIIFELFFSIIAEYYVPFRLKKSFPVDTRNRVPYDAVMLHYQPQNLVNKLLMGENISGNNRIS